MSALTDGMSNDFKIDIMHLVDNNVKVINHFVSGVR